MAWVTLSGRGLTPELGVRPCTPGLRSLSQPSLSYCYQNAQDDFQFHANNEFFYVLSVLCVCLSQSKQEEEEMKARIMLRELSNSEL